MGMDATKPLEADEFTFKRIAVPGQNSIDLNEKLDARGALPETYKRQINGKSG